MRPSMPCRRVIAGLTALSALGIGCTARQTPTAATPSPPAQVTAPANSTLSSMCGNSAPAGASPPHHVVMIQMENESLSNIIGNANASYQTQLAHQCGMDANMWAISHPSLPNYLAENTGTNVHGTFPDCTPSYPTSSCISSDDNLFHQMQVAGHTWRGYAEGMPANCSLRNSGRYAARHNPPVYFSDLHSASGRAPGPCATYDVVMGSLATKTGRFYSDLASGKLPTYSFVAPDLIDDAHSSSVATGDKWLSRFIPLITSGANYRSGDTDIVIAYDEGAGGDKVRGEDCTNQTLDLAGRQPSCHIPFIVVAPYEKPGTVATSFCTLYCFTRTVEVLYHLPLLGHAADRTTNDLTTSFNLSPT